MILLLGLVVLVVVLASSGALGIGVLGGSMPKAAVGLAIPVAAALTLVVLAGLVLGIGGDEEDDGDRETATQATTVGVSSLLPSRTTGATTTIPSANLEVPEDGRFALYLPVGGLRPGGVVHVRAAGFRSHEAGRIQQCVTEAGHLPACTEPFPVQFDGDGRADFQVALSGEFAPSGCRVGQPACSLRLTGEGERRQATQQFVLVDEVKPGQVTITPSSGVVEGQTVEVAVSGFPAGERVAAVLCALPGTYDPRRCSDPASSAVFAVDGGGSGRGALTIASGAARCGPSRQCGVVVIVGDGYVAAAPVAVTWSRGPGVGYQAGRVVPGAMVALVLVAIAIAIAVKTDWTKPTEAATPELDEADLRTDQSLDDLFGADAELEARDPIPW